MKSLLAALTLLALPAVAQDNMIMLNIRFDAATVADLQKRGELVVVAAMFYGAPSPGNTLPVDEMGQIYLGTEEFTVWPKDQDFAIGGSLGAAPFDSVLVPMVNVNVYSARLSDERNLLDCSFVDGPLLYFAKAPQNIICTLLDG